MVLTSLFRVPSNESTMLAQELMGSLVTFDLRYNLSWVYGGFIDSIPERIGVSRALDAAVAALLASHTNLITARGKEVVVSIESLTKYSQAVKTLRVTLDDPITACTTETLCAVTLLLICQGFFHTADGHRTSHGEGAAQILKARRHIYTQDTFEHELLLMLRGPVLFEALINPKISFTPREWTTLIENPLKDSGAKHDMMTCLTHAPDLIQRGTIALRDGSNLDGLIAEARSQYQLLTELLNQLHGLYSTVREPPPYQFTVSPSVTHCQLQRTYGIVLAVCLYFNCISKALEPDNISLELDSISFCEEVIDLADKAAIYRPLGASYILLCAMAAWCSSSDSATRITLEAILMDYGGDFLPRSQASIEGELRSWFKRLSLSDIDNCPRS